jgi:branched-chain amino acid transport system substrate-binding protein
MSRALSRAALSAVLLATALAGCTGLPMPVPTTAPPTPTGDGILRIGTLFPASGGLAVLSPGQVAGVNAAVREINATGGVLGVPVEVLSRDAGADESGTAAPSFDDLVARGADVVIGPSSSTAAESLLAAAAAASVPIISPSATAAGLTGEGGGGWFFRTIPSDADQGEALAGLLAAEGGAEVALVGTGGEPGSATAQGLASALAAEDDGMLTEVPGDGDPAAVAGRVVASGADAVVLATPDGGEGTVALIAALTEAGYGGEKLWLIGPNVASYGDALPAGALTGVRGIQSGVQAEAAAYARILLEDPGVPGLRYAAEAYDATILAALAATLAGDDGGASIGRLLSAASAGGIPCTSYGECLDVLSTEDDIDYRGVTGSLDLDENGDLIEPRFVVYGFTPENALVLAE